MDFKTWTQTTESINTISYGDFVRDTYVTPNSIHIVHNVTMPRSIFKASSQWAMVDLILPLSKREEIETLKGELSEDFYTEDGYGVPLFSGEDCLEKAFNYTETNKGVCHA